MARRILKKGLHECGDYNNEAQGLYLRCNIVLHKKDAKFLAVRLAQLKKSPSLLSPSQPEALLQGQHGMYWEEGRDSWYTEGGDWAATSTGALMNYNISKKALNLDFSALNSNEDTSSVADEGDEDFAAVGRLMNRPLRASRCSGGDDSAAALNGIRHTRRRSL